VSLLPAILAQRGVLPGPFERFMPLALPAVFGPTIAAVYVTWRESGRDGVRALFARFRIRGVGSGWYVFALAYTTVIYAAGVAVYSLFGHAPIAWAYFPAKAEHVMGMLVVPFAEEVGWRGFALPRLQRDHSRLSACAILAVVWALWHTPMFLVSGYGGTMLALAYAYILAGCVLFSWVFNRTSGSLLIAWLMHVGAHLNAPTHAIPPNMTAVAVAVVAVNVAGVLVVAFDRAAWTASVSGAANASPAGA
jgi:membrane protease YdiL (CAAX protease family)